MESWDYLIELRDSTGMTRREFCEYFEIPYRTLQNWELGNRKMSEYILRLMAYKIKMDLAKKKDSSLKDAGEEDEATDWFTWGKEIFEKLRKMHYELGIIGNCLLWLIFRAIWV